MFVFLFLFKRFLATLRGGRAVGRTDPKGCLGAAPDGRAGGGPEIPKGSIPKGSSLPSGRSGGRTLRAAWGQPRTDGRAGALKSLKGQSLKGPAATRRCPILILLFFCPEDGDAALHYIHFIIFLPRRRRRGAALHSFHFFLPRRRRRSAALYIQFIILRGDDDAALHSAERRVLTLLCSTTLIK